MTSLPAFILLYAALYGAYGSESPFLPSFLAEKGLSASEIGIVLAAGSLVRLIAGPAVGYLADRRRAPRTTLVVSAVLAGALSFGYLGGRGFWVLLLVGTAHAAAIASLAPLSDALALVFAKAERFAYGWIRGAGSAAFIVGTLASGQLVGTYGLPSVVVSSGLLFTAMAAAALLLPYGGDTRRDPADLGAIRQLALDRGFQRLVLAAALIIGSHTLNDAFAVIRWREAGIGPMAASILWSAAVLSEVLVFTIVGPGLLQRIGPARAALLAACCGVVRWAIMAATTAIPALALAQLSHGLTFALLHLAAMQVISATVSDRLAASAQALYGTVGLGAASVLLALASGWLYARFGAAAYWAMAALCAAAIPAAIGLPGRSTDS